jgi:hypothetical protein
MAVELSADYPQLDPRRLALLADRLARIGLARAWLDNQGSIVRDEDGRVFDVVDRLEKWSNRAESILADLEAERQAAHRDGGLARLEEQGRRALEARGMT